MDELNRTSPKVQSAFLEVMQESQVSLEGETLSIDPLFMVLATQVPNSGISTYLLSDVQLDRFVYKIDLTYPEDDVEIAVLHNIDQIKANKVKPVIDLDTIVTLKSAVKNVYVHKHVHSYIVDLVMWLRSNPLVLSGPSTRATICLLKGARAIALVNGRDFVIPDDIKTIYRHVLMRRIELSNIVKSQGESVLKLVNAVINIVPLLNQPYNN